MPPRFDVYKSVSRQIRENFAEATPQIEPLSLDEAYLDVTENLKGMDIATDIALEIRAKIKAVTGLNASAGISYNKFLAKMASDLNKPNGQAVITPKHGPGFVEALPIKKFHGVGPATAERMKRHGIETGADLKSKSLHFLTEHFGKTGAYFYGIARGIAQRQVRPDSIRKSVGAGDTFIEDIDDLDLARAELRPLRKRFGAIAKQTTSAERLSPSRSNIRTSRRQPAAARPPSPSRRWSNYSTRPALSLRLSTHSRDLSAFWEFLSLR